MGLRFQTLALLLLGFLAGRAEPNEERKQPPKLSPEVEKNLDWLPTDTETVIVSQQPYEIAAEKKDEAAARKVSSMLLSMTMRFRGGFLFERLKGRKIELAIEGSRKYGIPKAGWGLAPFEGCTILLFDDEADDAIQQAMRDFLDKSDEKIRLEGTEVAVFSEQGPQQEEDVWSYFVTRPQRATLLCATSRSFLEDVLKRRQNAGEGRTLPRQLFEWKHVNVTAPVWGIRHYRSIWPLIRGKVGFTFSYDPDAEKNVEVRYLSAADADTEAVAKQWDQTADLVVEQPSPGVTKASFNFGRSADLVVLLLFECLGHTVFI